MVHLYLVFYVLKEKKKIKGRKGGGDDAYFLHLEVQREKGREGQKPCTKEKEGGENETVQTIIF